MAENLLPENVHIYTVSELNHLARNLVEGYFQSIWIEGEISNFSCPTSGHWYFSLKDENAQIRCAMFRSQQMVVKFQPKDGAHVMVRAKGSIYENRGEFQLIVDKIEEIGLGSLQKKFEALKAKLLKEGLFDEQHKKLIPRFPKTLGIITSSTGAALQDVLNILKRRYPIVFVLIYPTLVQGETAAPTIAEAIERANQDHRCDTLLLVRGGGSLEDLWPFNEEVVARAIFNSTIPIISGVGHEIDFTIADFVADKRAPTPSAAAELATPDRKELLTLLYKMKDQLQIQLKKSLKHYLTQLEFFEKRLRQCHPAQLLQQQSQALDRLEQALIKIQKLLLERLQQQLIFLKNRWQQTAPNAQIKRYIDRLQHHDQTLHILQRQRLEHIQQKLLALQNNLLALDPKAILDRGYSIIRDQNGNMIQSIQHVQLKQKIIVQITDGKIHGIVDQVEPGKL